MCKILVFGYFSFLLGGSKKQYKILLTKYSHKEKKVESLSNQAIRPNFQSIEYSGESAGQIKYHHKKTISSIHLFRTNDLVSSTSQWHDKKGGGH